MTPSDRRGEGRINRAYPFDSTSGRKAVEAASYSDRTQAEYEQYDPRGCRHGARTGRKGLGRFRSGDGAHQAHLGDVKPLRRDSLGRRLHWHHHRASAKQRDQLMMVMDKPRRVRAIERDGVLEELDVAEQVSKQRMIRIEPRGIQVAPVGHRVAELQLDLGVPQDRRELFLLPEPDEPLVRERGDVQRHRFEKRGQDHPLGMRLVQVFVEPLRRPVNRASENDEPAKNRPSKEQSAVEVTHDRHARKRVQVVKEQNESKQYLCQRQCFSWEIWK
jgi:hypothetical protein